MPKYIAKPPILTGCFLRMIFLGSGLSRKLYFSPIFIRNGVITILIKKASKKKI